MDRYEARMNFRGKSQRERHVNRLKQSILINAPSNPSCKDIILNGEPAQLVINTGTQPYYKEFETLPDNPINIGDYVEWVHSHWLVVVCDSDDEVYQDGKLNQCNWLLKWQNEKGKIIERWAVIISASKYNDGTTGNEIIQLGSDQLAIRIPVDEESLKLKKSISKKFFIDCYSSDSTVYELTGTGNVVDTYNGHGVTSWIVKECAFTPSENDLKYGVCNYITPTPPSQPISPDENPDKTTVQLTINSSKDYVKVGGSYTTFKGFVYDEIGNVTDDVGVFSIITDFANRLDINDITPNQIKIKASDDCFDLVRETIELLFTVGDVSVSRTITIEE